jgi:predicted negative regulator of RcsB-dependent stress response
MAFDLQEQEQIDSLKIHWRQWGRWVVLAVGCLALAYIGYRGYCLYRVRQVEASAAVYVDLEQAARTQDLATVKSAAARIEADYPSSPYAVRAAFLAARAAFDKNDLAYSSAQLTWAAANTKEPALLALAQLRLASVMLDQKQYDGAVAVLNRPHDAAYDALYYDAKGDAFFLKGDKGAARDAYRAALAKLAGDSPSHQYVQTKLDALGG